MITASPNAETASVVRTSLAAARAALDNASLSLFRHATDAGHLDDELKELWRSGQYVGGLVDRLETLEEALKTGGLL